jgi:sigma-B regulation protein RsbU (phosphoserine phosphatase)
MASLLSAAHPPLIHLAANGVASAVAADGEPLGIFGSVVLQRKEFPVLPGDRLFLYTDGLIEAGCSRDCGLGRLMEACVRRRSLPLAGAVRSIVEDLAPPDAAPRDDRLLLAIEVRPA